MNSIDVKFKASMKKKKKKRYFEMIKSEKVNSNHPKN